MQLIHAVIATATDVNDPKPSLWGNCIGLVSALFGSSTDTIRSKMLRL